jgi:glycosyltransferase involved in cell wall biosynthesis
MRVLYVTQSLDRGGSEKQLVELAKHSLHLGYVPIVVSLSGGGAWEPYLTREGVRVLTVPCRSPREWATPARLLPVIKQQQPHIVVSFLYHCSVWASIAARLAGVPIKVAARRDCGFQRAEAPLPRIIELIAQYVTTCFVANSNAVANYLCRDEDISPKKIKVIHNGIELPSPATNASSMLRTRIGIKESTVVVGLVANFWPHKNHLMLVRAARRVVNKGRDVVFVLAGRYWHYLEEVRKEIARLGLEENINIIEDLKGSENLIPAIDIGVLCSQSEGFSNTILEYMAYGKPVIATNVGGNPEAVIEGQTGYLINPSDDENLAKALCKLIDDHQLREEFGRRGQSLVKKKFSWDISLRQWDCLFRSCIP